MSLPGLREREDSWRSPDGAGAGARLSGALRRHWPFVLLLVVGLALRVVAQLAYRPALLYIDSYRYLADTVDLVPGRVRPIGYPLLLLRPLSVFQNLAVYSLANHVLGLGIAVAIYAVLLRLGTPRWLAAMATAPVLLDAYQLQIEQSVMSEPLFQALVLAGLVALVWRPRPGLVAATVAGLLLGLSVPVRLVSQPLVVPLVLFLLVVGGSRWRRLVGALLAALCFALPVVGYGLLYQHAHGEFGFSNVGGRVQYARVARFVDCEAVSLPAYQRPLCPSRALQEELIADEFAWDPDSPLRDYEPPAGRNHDEVFGDFARRVVAQQPLDYAAAVTRDFLKFFQWSKTQAPEDVALERWQFQLGHPLFPDRERLEEAMATYGRTEPEASLPLTRFLRAYQLGGGYTPGTVLLVALLAGTAGALGMGRARRSPLRASCLLFTLSGGGLLLASCLFEFSWRYQLPALVLLPVAGALGVTALLRGQEEKATSRAPTEFEAVDAAALEDFHERYGHPRLAAVAVVIAAYNEAEGIGGVLDELPDRIGDLLVDVIVVVDGATDETAAVAVGRGVYTCVAAVNRGQGAALRLGYRIAREGGAEYIITTDADGQYDPADMPVVLEPLLRGEADFVTGSRRLGREETDDGLRRFGVRVFALLVSVLTRQRISDTSNGLRAMRADVTAAVTLAQPQYQASELLIGVLARGYRVVERPTTMRARRAGTTKKGNNLVYGLRYTRVVLGTWWRERSWRRSAKSIRSNTTNLNTNSTP